MNTFKLEPADILVTVNDRQDPFSIASRWCVGPYDHVFAYLGNLCVDIQGVLLRHPFLFESSGRGVAIESLSNRYGQEVVVLRLNLQFWDRIPLIVEEAIRLASDPQSYYDYMCIPLNIIPRILHDKFGMPLPAKYDRNEQMVCSEACAEICWRAEVPVLPQNAVPLPGDFVELSGILNEVNRGILSEDWF